LIYNSHPLLYSFLMILRWLTLAHIQHLKLQLLEIPTILMTWLFLVSLVFKSPQLTNLVLDKLSNWKIWLNHQLLLLKQNLGPNRLQSHQTQSLMWPICSVRVISIILAHSIASLSQPKPLLSKHLQKRCLLIQGLNNLTLKMLKICNWSKIRQWAK